MQKILFVTCLCLQFLKSFSQSNSTEDSIKLSKINSQRIAENADLDKDDDRTFTRAEIMPKFKNGIHALEDTLTTELRKNNFKFRNKEIHLSLRIGKRGQIVNINQLDELKNENEIKGALMKTFGMWEPAMQNGFIVYAIKIIIITISKKQLTIKELN